LRLKLGQLGWIERKVLNRFFADADLMLSEQVLQLFTVDQGDRSSAALEGGLLGAAGVIRRQ
jgi:hypothetical protein